MVTPKRDPHSNEVAAPKPFDTRNLPSGNHLRYYVCADPKCFAIHVVGFDANENALFTFTADYNIVNGMKEKLDEVNG